VHRLSTPITAALTVALAATLAAVPGVSVAARDRQSARLIIHPRIAQPGTSPASANRARSAMTATLTPHRAGRKVMLQRHKGHRWVKVKLGRETRRGAVEFTAPYRVGGKIARYRVVALPHEGLPRKASAAASTDRWGAPDYSEQFSGTFSGHDLPRPWAHRLQGYGDVANRSCAASEARATRIAQGTARLMVLRSSGPDPVLRPTCRVGGASYDWRVNGNIGTRGGFSFRYGYAAARIKFQPRAGQHASFWLLPDASQAEPGTRGAEIDTIEWYGDRANDDNELANMIHYDDWPQIGGTIRNPGRFGDRWAGRYHVFSVEWTPRAYVFRIDGKRTRRINTAVSHQPEYLILSLVSSDFELKFAPQARRQTMHVDWVRVWDRQS
jgi:hypothetical protein